MSDIIVHEEQILYAEEQRIKLRDSLRSKGFECADNEPIDSLIDKSMLIQPINKLMDKTIEGDVFLPDATVIEPYAFYNCINLKSINAPNVSTLRQLNGEIGHFFYNCSTLESVILGDNLNNLGYYTFYRCTGLKNFRHKNVTAIGNYTFTGCTDIESIVLNRATGSGFQTFSGLTNLKELVIPSFTISSPNQFFTCGNLLKLTDLGNIATINTAVGVASKPIYKYMILRRTSAISTLSATSVLGTSTPNVYVPNALISSYETATNWSTLALNFIALEGSRFEDLDWYDDYNSTCELDGNEIKVLDDETVAIFKHTENITHVYENGVELLDTDTVAGKTLTSTI